MQHTASQPRATWTTGLQRPPTCASSKQPTAQTRPRDAIPGGSSGRLQSDLGALDLGVMPRRGDRAGLGVSCPPTTASPGRRTTEPKLRGPGAGDPILSGKAARLPARALPQTGRLHSPRLAPSSGSAVTARGAGHTRVRGCATRRRGGSASNRRARRGGLRRVTLVPSGRERRGGTD